MQETFERLAAARIQLLPAVELDQHFVFERDGFVALVERRKDGFGGMGAPGLLTAKGFAPLVWRGERAYFVAQGFEEAATEEQVRGLRSFSEDLKKSLFG